MRSAAAALLGLMLLSSACAQEPEPKEAEAAVANTAKDTADAVKLEKKSIEEAAEAAVKLVEEESRQEIEDLAPDETL